MIVERARLAGDARPVVYLLLVRTQRSRAEIRDDFVDNAFVSRRGDVLKRRVNQPQSVVRKLGANSLSTGLVPPVLDVTFEKLPRSGKQDMVPDKVGRRHQERQRILQLIAKAERPTRLV